MKTLFESDVYQKDQPKFFYVERNRQLDSSKVYTDNFSYVVCQGEPNWPVWVWTLDNLTFVELKQLKKVLTTCFVGNELRVTSRKQLYDYLVDTKYPYLDYDSYFEMGFLKCDQVVKPNSCDGYLDKVRLDEVDLLSEYVYLNRL